MNGEIKSANHFWIVTWMMILGFSARFLGVWFGLPDLFHADEPVVVNHALAFGSGDFNPHFFNIPPLVSYLLFLVYGIYFVLGKAVGMFSGPQDFLSAFLMSPTSFYLIARILFGALIGTVTIYLIYRLGKKFFSLEHGLLAAALLALNFLHVRDSHYIYVDIPLAAVLVLSFFPVLTLIERFEFRTYLCFGVLLGIATATKYNGALIMLPFLVVHFAKHRSQFVPLALALLISIATFFILNPFALLDWKFFFSELSEQAKSTDFVGFFHHLGYSLNEGVGSLVLICAMIGIIRSIASKRFKLGVVVIYVLSYYAVLCFKSQPYDRYVLPMIPFLMLLAAEGLIVLKKEFKLSRASFVILVFAVMVPSLLKVILSDFIFLEKDTRTISRSWVESFVPAGSKVALDSPLYLPRLKPTMPQLEEKKAELSASGVSKGTNALRLDTMIKQAGEHPEARYELYFLTRAGSASGFLFSKPEIPYDLAVLKSKGIQYVIVGPMSDQESPFFEALTKNADLVAQFTPYQDSKIQSLMDSKPLTGGPFLWKDLFARERNGTIISIYRITA